MSKREGKTMGLGFFSGLALLFIGLKLTGYIDWAWWIVLAPLWVGPVLFLTVILVMFAGVITFNACSNALVRWRQRRSEKLNQGRGFR